MNCIYDTMRWKEEESGYLSLVQPLNQNFRCFSVSVQKQGAGGNAYDRLTCLFVLLHRYDGRSGEIEAKMKSVVCRYRMSVGMQQRGGKRESVVCTQWVDAKIFRDLL